MHGLIANQLRAFTVAEHGRDMWVSAVQLSGGALPEGPPSLSQQYPDDAVVGVATTIAGLAGIDIATLLEHFGDFLATTLVRVYEPVIHPSWRALDVVEHVEEQVHAAVRHRDPEATPPALVARRTGPDRVEVEYRSPRRLCYLGEGIIRGLGRHYHERLVVEQPECMLRGDERCLIVARRVDGD